MDWDRVNVWTNTFYTLIHSLNLSKQIHFGNLTVLKESIVEASEWVLPECSYSSVLLEKPFGRRKVSFRRDPNRHFGEIAGQVTKMLIQDLVVIADEMMSDIIVARGATPSVYPQSKIQQLAPNLDSRYKWAEHGCLELVAVRNVLTHAKGRWNRKSLDIVDQFLTPPPIEGDKLIVGIPMLFRYRKAIRTFLNETSL